MEIRPIENTRDSNEPTLSPDPPSGLTEIFSENLWNLREIGGRHVGSKG
jgi:hypothetical protein